MRESNPPAGGVMSHRMGVAHAGVVYLNLALLGVTHSLVWFRRMEEIVVGC